MPINSVQKKLSVVLPCLNEEGGVGICINKIQQVFARQGLDGEIIVVDNGCTDRTVLVARSLGVRIVTEPRSGYGNACRAGINQAQGELIIIGDADNSYDFFEMPKLLEGIEQGGDLVVGSRFLGQMQAGAMSYSRKWGNYLLRLLLKSNGLGIQETCTGFIAFRKEVLTRFCLVSSGMEFSSEVLLRFHQGGLKIQEVPINYYKRVGTSKLNEFRDGFRHFTFILRQSLGH